jgi:hypothetical protein
MTLTSFLRDIVIDATAIAKRIYSLSSFQRYLTIIDSYGGSFYTENIYADPRWRNVSEISIISP